MAKHLKNVFLRFHWHQRGENKQCCHFYGSLSLLCQMGPLAYPASTFPNKVGSAQGRLLSLLAAELCTFSYAISSSSGYNSGVTLLALNRSGKTGGHAQTGHVRREPANCNPSAKIRAVFSMAADAAAISLLTEGSPPRKPSSN